MTEEKNQINRRSFLGRIGLGSILASFAGIGFSFIRSLVPSVLYEPPRRVKVGTPDSFAEGVKFLPDERLFIFREGRSFYAISAVCTHLGCTVKYAALNKARMIKVGDETREINWEFHCPCHGSKFYGDGTNYAGPAPQPLAWLKIEVAPEDGQLVVDLGSEVEQNFRLTV
jgi:menaquinol-cytochrome c reductase iron-sulfur subunit